MINDQINSQPGYVVYPGEYHPPCITENDLHPGDRLPNTVSQQLNTRTTEFADHYEIKIDLRGYRKEDLIVNIDGNLLTITAFGHNNIQTSPTPADAHVVCFNIPVILPEDTDSDFVRAEYFSGYLHIWFHKTDKPVLQPMHHIIVY